MAPIYYRWALKPSDGSVLLSHNEDVHPARTKTHAELGLEGNEPGMVHGYAYRIGGGWRLHDYEHRPLTDPYIKAQVAKTLVREEGGVQDPVAHEHPIETDQFQYGQPRMGD